MPNLRLFQLSLFGSKDMFASFSDDFVLRVKGQEGRDEKEGKEGKIAMISFLPFLPFPPFPDDFRDKILTLLL